MGIKIFVLILLISVATNTWSHHHHHHHHHGFYPVHRKENSQVDFVERKSNFKSEETTDTLLSESLKKSARHIEALDRKGSIPFSTRRVEKMLEKAILQIITGDLSTANMLLLKSLNYTPEEVLAIREREFDKRKDEESKKITESSGRRSYDENLYGNRAKHWNYNSMEFDSSSRYDPDVDVSRKRNRYEERDEKNLDFDAYNRQAVVDYENLASKLELQQQSWSEPANFDYEEESKGTEEQDSQNLHRSFDRAMEPHVIFKIPYDDSEFDSSSGSDERSRFVDGNEALVSSKDPKHRAPSTLRHTTVRNVANSFHASSLSTVSSSSAPSAATGHTPLPIVHQLGNFKDVRPNYTRTQSSFDTTESPEFTITSDTVANMFNVTSTDTPMIDFNDSFIENADNDTDRKISEYEGLEWIAEDIYRVIPAYADSLGYNFDDNETLDYDERMMNILPEESENDTLEYQNDALDQTKHFMANVNASFIENESSAYKRRIRQEENVTSNFDSQIQKTLNNIKDIVLGITGRQNNTNTNRIQREKLTMYSPTCQIPRNTDADAWTDPFSMNIHFQLNLTSSDHVLAAKLRIYKLPQENLTTFASGNFDEIEDDEKKIRITVYYYTKSLRRHRSKKRLMDSIMTPLTTSGKQLVLDVRQGVRFWQLIPRNSPHGNVNNHGLAIQIDDQDGRALKPALFIQQPSCTDHDSNQKSSSNLHFSSELVLVTVTS